MSSALPWTVSILSSPNSSITLFKNFNLLFNESNNVICKCGNIIFIGIPGKPAPVPTSIIFFDWFISKILTTNKLSIKCLIITSSYSVIDVKFITLFVSINIS